ncbi:MAG TPA: Hsp20 family protein [Trueperaceae bacterium]
MNTRPVGSLFDDFDQLFNELATPIYSRSQWAQGYPVDLYETGEEVVLEMAVPGIRVDDLDISIEGRQLTVHGVLPETADETRRYWLQSIPRGEFQRSVTLPTGVEADQVHASIQNGLLVLKMPKVAAAKARKIAINNG